MAPFSEDDLDRLDRELLQNGAVTLYWRRSLFERDLAWLTDHNYTLHRIDCTDVERFRNDMTRALQFRENFGYEPWSGNLDALNDAFRSLEFDSTGLVFSFVRMDLLARADSHTARGTLDIIERHSRDSLLLGNRLLALVQSDDPAIQFDPIGARSPEWNGEEWFNASRGL